MYLPVYQCILYVYVCMYVSIYVYSQYTTRTLYDKQCSSTPHTNEDPCRPAAVIAVTVRAQIVTCYPPNRGMIQNDVFHSI